MHKSTDKIANVHVFIYHTRTTVRQELFDIHYYTGMHVCIYCIHL